jgi:hypothetical protein
MAGVFTNKFTIEVSDVARIVFFDERPASAPSLTAPSSTAAEVVMSLANFIVLAEQFANIAEQMKASQTAARH